MSTNSSSVKGEIIWYVAVNFIKNPSEIKSSEFFVDCIQFCKLSTNMQIYACIIGFVNWLYLINFFHFYWKYAN